MICTILLIEICLKPKLQKQILRQNKWTKKIKKKWKVNKRKEPKKEEIKFKTIARRNRLLGEWVGKEIGMSEENIKEYASQVVMADFAEPGDQDVIRKVMADLTAASSSIDEETLKLKMSELLNIAKDQIMNK